jgi:hypothetical protein
MTKYKGKIHLKVLGVDGRRTIIWIVQKKDKTFKYLIIEDFSEREVRLFFAGVRFCHGMFKTDI